ncbi:hypothetical protein ACIQRW_15125 [Streptomyces sp. NPDC091287]|uniref:hypothetical protein n=1 Tax=Streptomyces sp. NPDC091287 TaxID=3365988 RepID=UPI00380802EA
MPVPEARVQIQVDGVWTDITDDVKGGAELVHTRGRSGEGARVDRASVNLTLKSPDGKYYPRHPMSPYYGRLGRNTPMRHLAGGSPVSLRVGDVAAGRLITPDHSSLDITGDLDLRVDAAFDEWPTTGNAQEVMAKWLTTGDQRSWMLTVWRSRILLYWTTDGLTVTSKSSAVIPARPGQRVAIRVTLDVNNGASGHTATFYTAPTIAGPWTALGAPVVTSGTTSIFSGSGPVEIGDLTGIVNVTAAANVFAAEIRTGIDGTVVANPDLTAQAAGATGFTDSAGRLWSTAGGAEITEHRARAVVEVPTWAPRWTVGGADMDVALQGAGVLRRLSQGQKALESTLRRRVPSYGPLAYWPLEDTAGSTSAFSPIEGVAPLRVTGVSFGQDASLAGSAALPTIEAGGRMVGAVPAPVGASTQWSVHMVYSLDGTPPVSNGEFMAWRTSGTVRRWRLLQRTGVGTIEGYNAAGDLIVDQPVAAADEDVLAGWNRYHFRVSQTGGTVDWRLTWININGDAGAFGGSYSGTAGRVTQIETQIGASVDGLRVGHVGVFATEFTDAYSFADHGFTGETAGARALRLTTEEGLPFTLVGTAADTPPMGPQRPDTLLNLLLECEASDGGILHEDRGRLGLVYRARTTLYNQEPALVLAYSQIVQPFEPVDDDTHIRNDVTRSRTGGSSVRLVQEAGPLSVASPADGGVGVYDEAVELSLETDDQLDGVTAWALHLGTWDEARYKQLRILLHKHPDLIEAAAQLDVGDLVRITDLPAYLPPGPVDLMVEGYRETLSNLSWELILNCSPGGPWQVGVVEDPVLGRADTDGTELAAGVTATDTGLPVTVTAGPRWVTAAPNQLADPGFEAGTGAWACSRGASIGVVTWERGIVRSGTGAARITRVHLTDTGTLNMQQAGVTYGAAPGQTWAAHAWVYNGSMVARDMRMGIVWRDAGGVDTFILPTLTSVAPGQWVRLAVAGTLPAGAVSVYPSIVGGSGWTVGEWWIADDARLARTDTYVGTDMPAEFPFDVTIGGEQVTVTSIGPVPADDFVRTSTGGWGVSSSGHEWQVAPAASAPHFTVNAGVGTIAVDGLNTTRRVYLPSDYRPSDVDARVAISIPALAAGGNVEASIMLRVDPADVGNTYYYGEIEFNYQPSRTVRARIMRRQNGADTALSTAIDVPGLTYTAGAIIRCRFRAVGPLLQLRAWADGSPEPTTWAVEVTDTALSSGRVGLRAILDPPNTNTLPFPVNFRDFSVAGDQLMTVTRSVNGIAKPHSAGAPLSLTHPMRAAL